MTSHGGLLRVLKSPCKISPAWDPRSGGSAPKLVDFEAIWDTGATGSVVTQEVIDACALAPTGIVRVHGVHGAQLTETYLVNIALPNNVVFASLRVTKGTISGAAVLIGMDIIAAGDFSVTNCQGFTKASYRTPSIEHIDYVEMHNKLFRKQTQPSTRAERRRKRFGRE